MKCEKCGYEIKKNDKFCENCGSRIENTQFNKNDVKIAKQNKKSKNKFIIGTVIGVILLIILGGMCLIKPTSKNVEIEASELAKLISEENEEQYYGDNLFVHGYLVRDTKKVNNRFEEYYVLVSNVENLENLDELNEMVMFTFEKGLDENLGTGSEITIQGKLYDRDEDGFTNILIGEEIEIHQQVEPIHVFTNTTDLINQSDKYLNKTVRVLGKLVIINMSGAYVTDEKLVDTIWLYNISSSELVETQQRGGWCNITGKLILDGATLAIEVESIEQNEYTDEIGIKYEDLNLEYIETNFDRLIGKDISVIGNLPIDLIEVETGRYAPALLNEDHSLFIELSGKVPTIGGCAVRVEGRLENINGNYVLRAYSYEELSY